ncbi:MAG: iron-sulfur protein [Clostridiales bacterium]|nr:iron-sulfur protein [Clostridiales bacterium]
MKILVLNGSPKGEMSITLQTVQYLSMLHPEHTFEIQNVGAQIRLLERDFTWIKTALESADMLLFSYPVYTFIAPYQLHRFIELMKASGISFAGKFAAQLTTSKHFYDVTAHRYIKDNCLDMGMKYLGGLSADMEDLLSEKGRKEAEAFFRHIMFCAEKDIFEKLPEKKTEAKKMPVSVPESHGEKTGDIVIITDAGEEEENLRRMIARFSAVSKYRTRIVNIGEYPFRGGCLGCFNCAVSGKCIYTDGFDEFLREKIQKANAIVYAYTVRDHSMGSRFKLYDDRQFCNGHRTVTIGMPVGYLVSGDLSGEENLRMIMEARAQVGGNFLSGIASDADDPDREIDILAEKLAYALENAYTQPQNFYGIGGMKIFRDLIWQMRGMMRADHKFYKAHRQYDFPQKKPFKALAMYAVGALIANPKIKAKMGNRMNEGMLMPYKKVLDDLKK